MVKKIVNPVDLLPDENPDIEEIIWKDGIFSEYRECISGVNESPAIFHFGVFCTFYGLILSRRVSVYYGTDIFPNFYTCLVGKSGATRKSTAIRTAMDMLKYGSAINSNGTPPFEYMAGLGSGEGLLQALDGEGKTLLVDEGEFRNIISKGSQGASNILIPKLTVLWDCPPIQSLRTRTNPVEARNPFLSIISGSTVDWIQEHLSSSDVAGGFANRFLYIKSYNTNPISWPDRPDEDKSSKFISHLNDIYLWSKDFFSAPEKGQLSVDNVAKGMWKKYYDDLFRRMRKMNDTESTLVQRIPVYAMKLAILYAASDFSQTIKEEHLYPAIEFAKQQEKDTFSIFLNYGASKDSKAEEKILGTIKEKNHISKRDLCRITHMSLSEIEKLVRPWVASGLIDEQRSKSSKGYFVKGYTYSEDS